MLSFPPSGLRFRRGHYFHNILVFLAQCEKLHPLSLIAGVFLAICAAGMLWPAYGATASIIAIAAMGTEAAIIVRTWFTFSSPSPFNGPFFAFAIGHVPATALIVLVPLSPGVLLTIHVFVQAGLLGAMVWASAIEPFRVTLRSTEMFSDKINGECRVLVISDLHLDRFGRREEKTLEIARQFTPHLIAMPGDFTNLSFVGDALTRIQTREFVRELCKTAPVFAALGTPEVDAKWWISSILQDTCARLLHNESENVRINGNDFHVMGVTFQGTGEEQVEQLKKLATQNPGLPSMLLLHSPDLFEAAASAGVDLYIAGHTHGGQVRFPPLGAIYTASHFGNKYAHGTFNIKDMTMVVSRGIGLEGAGAPRLRFCCPPEVVGISIKGRLTH